MEKLQSKMLFVDVIVALVCGLAALPAGAQEIASGFDLYKCYCAPSWVQMDAGSMLPAIPADFFFPGSEPWTGRVHLEGLPAPNWCERIHMVIERTDWARMPGPATVPVEMVSLSLRSEEPITVTDAAGGEPRYYDVNMTVSPYVASNGNMVIEKTMGDTGGKFCINDGVENGIELYLQFSFFEAWPGKPTASLNGPLQWFPPDPVKLKTDGYYGWQTAAPQDACLQDNGYYPVPGQHILMRLDDGNSGELTVTPQGTGPGWYPGDPYKMHFPQLPDPCGWDVEFALMPTDDWLCTETGPVSDIHFWMSWEGDNVGTIESTYVAIYSDDPCGSGGYSEPNEELWFRHFSPADFTVRYAGSGDQGWLEPPDIWLEHDHAEYYQINITDIAEPFTQEQGTIYWLGVTVVPEQQTPQVSAGWKTSIDHWNDDAVWYYFYLPGGGWRELIDPCTGESLDLAFVITGQPAEPELDFGDAPDPNYPTLLASDGARHLIAGPYFCDTPGGDAPDPEPDGQPHPWATGDDTDLFDESVDEYWDDPVELECSGYMGNGPNTLFLTPPAGSVIGQTFARCRISTAGVGLPTGQADDGEVEDHRVVIEPETTCWDNITQCAGQSFGDSTCDGWINLGDLFALKMFFGTAAPWTPPECCSDYNHDNSVNLGDLFILKQFLGRGPYAPATGSQNCP
ncbi:MAG: DUF7901 domain-containing protein [Planctomycetota bacterium]|jgi:hypothetical protein